MLSNTDSYHNNHNLVPLDDRVYSAGGLFPPESSNPRHFLSMMRGGIEYQSTETRPGIIAERHSPL